MKKQHLKIALITLGVHSLYFFMFPTSLKITPELIKPQPMRVITKEITPPQIQPIRVINEERISESTTKISESKSAPTSTPSFLPKASPPKKIIVKKTPTKKPTPTTQKNKKTVKTVRGKLDKNVATIKAKSAPQKHKPPSLSTSKEQGIEGKEKHSYLQQISSSLKEWLTLPEKGVVKLTITVQANGKIVNIELLSSESEKNLHYLKTVLPGIKLPSFEENKEITFTITFCDD